MRPIDKLYESLLEHARPTLVKVVNAALEKAPSETPEHLSDLLSDVSIEQFRQMFEEENAPIEHRMVFPQAWRRVMRTVVDEVFESRNQG